LEYKFGINEDIFFRHIDVGNQSYDGEIKYKDQILKIEIAYPTLGVRSNEVQKQLLEKGGASEYYDPEELFIKIRRIIIDTAIKKAAKPYKETLLLLYYPFSENLFPGDVGLTEEMFEQFVNELKIISYKAEKVDFFVPAFKYKDYLEEQKCKPARLY
jgi:hypothetical protein